jgi:DDE family transposase
MMPADGGECVSDLGAQRGQKALFGEVASDSTAFRVVDRAASTPGLLDALRAARAARSARFWELHGAPERLTIDIDATLILAHSETEGAAGNYKGGYGFHPLQAYADQTREAPGRLLRPGNAGANTAVGHKTVLDMALAQMPAPTSAPFPTGGARTRRTRRPARPSAAAPAPASPRTHAGRC